MEEKTKKIDRRIIKTQKAIRNAFVKLLVEKDAEKITIKEIAETADVDRKTVYNYYSSVYDIWEDLENELVADLERVTQGLCYDIQNPLAVFEALTQIVNDNIEVYERLMQTKPDPRISGKVYEYLRKKVRATIETSPRVKPDRVELATEFVTSGLFSAYRNWFVSGCKIPLEKLTHDLGVIVVEGVSQFLIKD